MFYKIIEDYADIIRDYSVSEFKRYDNASSLVAFLEFREISTFPHHRHLQGKIEDSQKRHLADIVEIIAKKLRK